MGKALEMWFTMGDTWIYCMWPSQNNRDWFLYKDNLGHSWRNWKSKIWVSHLFCFCGHPPPPGWVTMWQKSRTRNCRIQKRPNWLVSLFITSHSHENWSTPNYHHYSLLRVMLLGTFIQTLHLKGWIFSEPGHAGSQASRKWTCGVHSYGQAIAGGKKEKRREGWRKKG